MVAGLIVFAIGMGLATIMDMREQMVYRYVWLICTVGVFGVLLGNAKGSAWSDMPWGELVFFVLLQQFFFAKFYGRADCHAFSVCAGLLFALECGLKDYLIHMLLVFGMLLLFQSVKGNVQRNGQLKKPVALIPYITTTLLVWVDFRMGKW